MSVKDWRPPAFPPGVQGFRWATHAATTFYMEFGATPETFAETALAKAVELRNKVVTRDFGARYHPRLDLEFYLQTTRRGGVWSGIPEGILELPSRWDPKGTRKYPVEFQTLDLKIIKGREKTVWETLKQWCRMYGWADPLSPSLDGEHDEGIWIPGSRFAGFVAPNRQSAEIRDQELNGRIADLDREALADFATAVAAVGAVMRRSQPEEPYARMFEAYVSLNRTLADVVDGRAQGPSRPSLIALDRDDVDELVGLSSALMEVLEAA